MDGHLSDSKRTVRKSDDLKLSGWKSKVVGHWKVVGNNTKVWPQLLGGLFNERQAIKLPEDSQISLFQGSSIMAFNFKAAFYRQGLMG